MNTTEPGVYLSTAEIARRLGTTVNRVGVWITSGVNGAGGARVRLDARKIGGRYKATEAALEAFLRACDGRDAPPVSETEAARARRVAKDLADCDRMLGRTK
jgi:hypothetical protein